MERKSVLTRNGQLCRTGSREDGHGEDALSDSWARGGIGRWALPTEPSSPKMLEAYQLHDGPRAVPTQVSMFACFEICHHIFCFKRQIFCFCHLKSQWNSLYLDINGCLLLNVEKSPEK